LEYNSRVIPFTSLPEGWIYSTATRVLSIDPLSVTEFGKFTLIARLKEFPNQSTADTTTKTVFNLAACKVENLKYFYALGSGPQSFPLSKYKQIHDSCEIKIGTIQV